MRGIVAGVVAALLIGACGDGRRRDGGDAGARDAGARDAGARDAGSTDAGARDAGARDGGSTDAGASEGGLPDASPSDAAVRDGGPDASTDAGPDASMDAGTDASTDAGPEAGADAGSDGGPCPPGVCFLLTGSGCPSGEACYFASDAGSDPEPVCEAAGTAGDGDACSAHGDCAEGYGCTSDGVCRRYCCSGSDASCPSGQTCAIVVTTTGGTPTQAGFCTPPPDCDPIEQTGCSAGEGWYPSSVGTICIASTEDLGEGESCTYANDCAPGLVCVSGSTVCHRMCDTRDGTPCGSGQTCTSFGRSDLPHLGMCTPPAGS